MRIGSVAMAWLAMAGVLACDDQPLGPTTGDVLLTVATTGVELPRAYTIAWDDGAALPIAVNESKTFAALSAGQHTVLLAALAQNCTVTSPNPQQVDVAAGETTQVSFTISCAANGPPDISGAWDWTEQYVNPVCHDTGTYVFSQTAATFTGRSDQVGVCQTVFGELPNNSTNEPVRDGIVSGSTITFIVGANGQCSYRATITGDHLAGTTTCGNSTGAWEAVRGASPASVSVTPTPDTMQVGTSRQLAAELRDVIGRRVFRPVTWSSDNPAVATVSGSGEVTSVSTGTATITATAGDTHGTAAIVVPLTGFVRVSAVTTGVDINPDGYWVTVGGAQGQRIDPNGTVTVDRVMPGIRDVLLTALGVNCDVDGSNPRPVGVSAGDTAAVTFDVTCGPMLRIAFTSTRDGDAEIYRMKVNGTELERLTTNPASDGGPDWSPDGTKIAFHSDRDGNGEIYTMNGDGSGLTRLTTDPGGDYSPVWSPDGTRIAFVSTRDGNAEIYVVNADGSNPVRLTNDPADDQEPAWSPDGTQIAFQSSGDGSTAIYMMNADGSARRRVTAGPFDLQPAWSPDGTKMVFTAGDCFYYECTFDVSIVNADGSGRARLAVDAWWQYPAWQHPTQPAWSPDGRKILFVGGGTYCDVYDCVDYSSLLIVNVDGSGLAVVDNPYDSDPAWRRP